MYEVHFLSLPPKFIDIALKHIQNDQKYIQRTDMVKSSLYIAPLRTVDPMKLMLSVYLSLLKLVSFTFFMSR